VKRPSRFSCSREEAGERFRLSFFEDPNSARDGLDAAALAQLKGEERARAEDMLLEYLPDSRGVIGLGVLRSRRAEFPLAQLFEVEQRRQVEARSTCVCRKLDSAILMVKAAKDRS
jgi:hypothetical protein